MLYTNVLATDTMPKGHLRDLSIPKQGKVKTAKTAISVPSSDLGNRQRAGVF